MGQGTHLLGSFMFPLRLASVPALLTGSEGSSGAHLLQLTLQQHHKHSLVLGDPRGPSEESHFFLCLCQGEGPAQKTSEPQGRTLMEMENS